MLSAGQVGDNSCPRVIFYNIENIAALDTTTTVLPSIGVVTDLQHTPSDVFGLTSEKVLDIVAVDGLSPLETELAAYRSYPA